MCCLTKQHVSQPLTNSVIFLLSNSQTPRPLLCFTYVLSDNNFFTSNPSIIDPQLTAVICFSVYPVHLFIFHTAIQLLIFLSLLPKFLDLTAQPESSNGGREPSSDDSWPCNDELEDGGREVSSPEDVHHAGADGWLPSHGRAALMATGFVRQHLLTIMLRRLVAHARKADKTRCDLHSLVGTRILWCICVLCSSEKIVLCFW